MACIVLNPIALSAIGFQRAKQRQRRCNKAREKKLRPDFHRRLPNPLALEKTDSLAVLTGGEPV
jgi:hypothetical protein